MGRVLAGVWIVWTLTSTFQATAQNALGSDIAAAIRHIQAVATVARDATVARVAPALCDTSIKEFTRL